MNEQVRRKDFGLHGERACITGLRNKEKYMAYQDNYRETYGVFPELDQGNGPFTALWDDVYNLCRTLCKSGLAGALYYHDLHGRYRRRMRQIYENYKKEWSFLLSIDLERRTLLKDIPKMAPGERMGDRLGYRKDGNGNYYEGTWANGKLVYGLVYLAAQDVFFAGSFDESGNTDCRGVFVDLGDENARKRQISTVAGNFRFRNGRLELYDGLAVINTVTVKDGEFCSMDSKIGRYSEGYAEGLFIHKEISDEIRVGWLKYRDGEVRKSSSSLGAIPRTFMMFYMLIWYAIKYLYGSILLVTPLYYYFKKKNWKI